MDKNLDELILGRNKNKSFFSKLLKKKDRISDAKKFFAKKDKKEQKEREKNKNPNSQFRRLLIYLLFVLVFVLSIFLTPYRTHLEMAYPSGGNNSSLSSNFLRPHIQSIIIIGIVLMILII